jgi:hypothetical protein
MTDERGTTARGINDRSTADESQDEQKTGEQVPGGTPATPLGVADDGAGSRSVAGAAPDGGALQNLNEADSPGEQGISSSGNTIADDTREDAKRGGHETPDGGESVSPDQRG